MSRLAHFIPSSSTRAEKKNTSGNACVRWSRRLFGGVLGIFDHPQIEELQGVHAPMAASLAPPIGVGLTPSSAKLFLFGLVSASLSLLNNLWLVLLLRC